MAHLKFVAASMLAALAATSGLAMTVPAPGIDRTVPADGAETAGPVSEIAVAFDTVVDLVELVLVLPDGQKIMLHDSFNRGDEARGQSFAFALPEPVSEPGRYRIEIAASASDPSDNSVSTASIFHDFTLVDPSADED